MLDSIRNLRTFKPQRGGGLFTKPYYQERQRKKMREGYLITIPSRGHTRAEYRAIRQHMKKSGLTDEKNQFATREAAEATMLRYQNELPADARVLKFTNL